MGIIVTIIIFLFVGVLLYVMFSRGGGSSRISTGSHPIFGRTDDDLNRQNQMNPVQENYTESVSAEQNPSEYNLSFGEGAPASMIETGADFNQSISDSGSSWSDSGSSSDSSSSSDSGSSSSSD